MLRLHGNYEPARAPYCVPDSPQGGDGGERETERGKTMLQRPNDQYLSQYNRVYFECHPVRSGGPFRVRRVRRVRKVRRNSSLAAPALRQRFLNSGFRRRSHSGSDVMYAEDAWDSMRAVYFGCLPSARAYYPRANPAGRWTYGGTTTAPGDSSGSSLRASAGWLLYASDMMEVIKNGGRPVKHIGPVLASAEGVAARRKSNQ